jgi:hypothetical protein
MNELLQQTITRSFRDELSKIAEHLSKVGNEELLSPLDLVDDDGEDESEQESGLSGILLA